VTDHSGPEAGWYPDPTDEAELRWWNGVGWSDDTTTISAAVAAVPPTPEPPVAPPTARAAYAVAAQPAPPAPQGWNTPNYLPPPAHLDGRPDIFDDASGPSRRSRSGRALWLMIGGIALIVAAVAVAVTVIVSSSYRSKLDTGAIETHVAASLSQRFGSSFAVTCPDNVALESGATFTCDANADDGTGLTVEVHQDDDQGNVTWRPVG
jgi:hypothetical protein